MTKAKIKKCKIHEEDLKKLREKAGLSLRELSKLSGVDFAIISKAENGYIVINEDTWNKLKKYL